MRVAKCECVLNPSKNRRGHELESDGAKSTALVPCQRVPNEGYEMQIGQENWQRIKPKSTLAKPPVRRNLNESKDFRAWV